MTSGILDEIRWPDDWHAIPFGRLADRRKDTGRATLAPLSVFLDQGVVPRSSREDNYNRLGADLSQYLVVEPGDFVFNKLRTWQGGLGVSEYSGIVSPAYFVCRPRPGLSPKFAHYALRSALYLQELTRVSKWMPPAQFDIGWEDLRDVVVRVPPLEVQRAITDHLDAETARIDALVSVRRRTRDLLADRRRVVVDRAVRPNGGRDWAHVPIKRMLQRIEQGWSPQCESRPADPGEWGVLKAGAANGGTFHPEENKALPPDLEPVNELARTIWPVRAIEPVIGWCQHRPDDVDDRAGQQRVGTGRRPVRPARS